MTLALTSFASFSFRRDPPTFGLVVFGLAPLLLVVLLLQMLMLLLEVPSPQADGAWLGCIGDAACCGVLSSPLLWIRFGIVCGSGGGGGLALLVEEDGDIVAVTIVPATVVVLGKLSLSPSSTSNSSSSSSSSSSSEAREERVSEKSTE